MSHLVRFSWADEKTPLFEYWENDQLQKRPLEFGQNFSLEIPGGPDCVGYQKESEWFPCPHRSAGVKKCEECRKKEGLAVAQFCDGYNLDLFTPEQLEQLNTPHYLYLALFQREVYKVGVSSLTRGMLRQIEQGSHYTLIFAAGMGGILARQVETFFRKCGIPDKIAASQKKEFVFPEISEEEGRQILQNIVDKYLPSVLFDHPEIKQFLKDPPEFKTFSSFYHLEAGEASKKPFHAVQLQMGESISGKILSVKGYFLVLETDTEKILLNTKDLSGFKVDFSEKPVGLETTEAFQSALF